MSAIRYTGTRLQACALIYQYTNTDMQYTNISAYYYRLAKLMQAHIEYSILARVCR